MPTSLSLLAAALLGLATTVPARDARRDGERPYAGTWTLDTARSAGLPAYYAQIRSHRLVVAERDSQLVVDVEIARGAGAPERFHFDYRLDGGETATTTRVRTPDGPLDVPTRLAAARRGDGTIHITITRELVVGGRPRPAVGTEDWEAGADGRTLVVHRVERLPQGGELRSDLVFTRG